MSLYKKSNQPGQVAQCKTPVSAQSSKRPVAPLVYRPQSVPKVLQRKSATAPPVYRPKQSQASARRPVPSRSQAVQRSLSDTSFGDLLPELYQPIANHMDLRSFRSFRCTSETFRQLNFDKWLVCNFQVNEDNFDEICNDLEKRFGPTIGLFLTIAKLRPESNLSERFWNEMREHVDMSELYQLLEDPDFTKLFS